MAEIRMTQLPQLSPSSVNCMQDGSQRRSDTDVGGRPKTTDASREAQRAAWREQKRRQRKDPLAKEKRRAYYLLNREKLLERQRRYYHTTWKLKECGIDVSRELAP